MPPRSTLHRNTILTGCLYAVVIMLGTAFSTGVAAVATHGVIGDNVKSVVYDVRTGGVWLDVPAGRCASTIEIRSETGILTGPTPSVVLGSFDVYTPQKLFLLKTTGDITGAYPLGPIIAPGMTEFRLSEDLTVGGGACKVDESLFEDLVYVVPEPASSSSLLLGMATLIRRRHGWSD